MVRIRIPDPAARDDKYLATRERLVIMVRMHWAVLLPIFLQTLGSIVLAILLTILLNGLNVDSVIGALPWWFALFMILRMLWRVADWHFDHLMITDKRLLKVSGIFFRKVQTMPLEKVTDLTYNRDPMGRLLGYGEFIVESAGQDQALSKIQFLPRPDRLYLTMCDMMFGGAPAPSGSDD
ncbi:PH domain-containing protein [Frankia sp. Cr2]|uniref:PH domain-containing protein n=1 Tax=Frankia sp. Cr2 TaxID=3073932 RepID=UPI002AD44399|nr:PH domain-containing protein [Frankia sp. Cr2]